MKKPSLKPARRHYRPAPALLTELPFVASPRHNYKHGRGCVGCLWQVPPIEDYQSAYEVGREYAAHFVQYLKDNPFEVGTNLLGRIVKDMDFADPSCATGYRVGFFSYLEQLIFEQVAHRSVFADLDRFNASGKPGGLSI